MSEKALIRRIRQHVRRQSVGYIALVFAMSGTAFAASGLITGSDVVNGSLSGVDVRNGSITARDIRTGTVSGKQVRNGSLGIADLAATTKAALRGKRGLRGATGLDGVQGIQGIPGTPGTSAPLAFAEFFALMPPDNAATVAVGGDVDFPQDGPTDSVITRTGADTFNLPDIGTYDIEFVVSVTEAGQLDLTLNGAELPYTVVGRATGTSQIVGHSLVTTTVINSVLTIRNPAGNSTALTITPLDGGTHPVSATLIIQRIA